MDKDLDSDSDAAQELLLLVKGSDCMSLALSLYLSLGIYGEQGEEGWVSII